MTLTVTDNDGLSHAASQQVTATEPIQYPIDLSASGRKKKSFNHVDFLWTGASSDRVDIYQDDRLVETTANDGEYTLATGTKGGKTFVYRMCEAGTSICSGDKTVQF